MFIWVLNTKRKEYNKISQSIWLSGLSAIFEKIESSKLYNKFLYNCTPLWLKLILLFVVKYNVFILVEKIALLLLYKCDIILLTKKQYNISKFLFISSKLKIGSKGFPAKAEYWTW